MMYNNMGDYIGIRLDRPHAWHEDRIGINAHHLLHFYPPEDTVMAALGSIVMVFDG